MDVVDSPAALPLLFPTGKVLQAQRSLTFGKWQGDRSRRHRPLLQQDDRGRQEDGRQAATGLFVEPHMYCHVAVLHAV